jgi:dTMP kinase
VRPDIRRRGEATAFVVVDGLDGAGKDTVAGILATLLAARERSVVVRSHPSSNPFGLLSRTFLLSRGKLARLLATGFFGLDALTSTALLRRLLRRHDAVVFVRYLLSAAYLPEPLSRPVHDLFASFLPDADVKIFVDARPEVALGRITERSGDREMFENPDSMERVRRRVAGLLDASWTVVDNNGTFRQTREQVEGLLPRISGDGSAGSRGGGRARG